MLLIGKLNNHAQYSLSVRVDHDYAIEENGTDDDEGEEGVGQHVDGDPTNWMEWRQKEQGFLSRKSVGQD